MVAVVAVVVAAEQRRNTHHHLEEVVVEEQSPRQVEPTFLEADHPVEQQVHRIVASWGAGLNHAVFRCLVDDLRG